MSNVVKKTYDIAALLALLNIVALVGLLGYLMSAGQLDQAKAQRIVEVMRGEDQQQPATSATDESAIEALQDQETDASAATQMTSEIMRREAERYITELNQRIDLSNAVMLRVTAEREAFHREQAEAARRAMKVEKQTEAEGFQKQVAIFELLSPKVAVEQLLGMGDLGDAARILAALDERRAKKIFEAAKTDAQKAAMRAIMQRVGEMAPPGSENGTAGESTAAADQETPKP